MQSGLPLAEHRAAWARERKTDPKVLAAARRQVRDQAREPVEQFGDGRQALADLEARTAAARLRFSDASRARALRRLARVLPSTTAEAGHRVGLSQIGGRKVQRLDFCESLRAVQTFFQGEGGGVHFAGVRA
ncbi:hypothetical protein [Streptomyces sp. NPDC002215]|uniref:hypothetical protein n=1 Tax=Streptomyces sp. NPDC002215 TaxID=3154412 RepID=UPI003333A03C